MPALIDILDSTCLRIQGGGRVSANGCGDMMMGSLGPHALYKYQMLSPTFCNSLHPLLPLCHPSYPMFGETLC